MCIVIIFLLIKKRFNYYPAVQLKLVFLFFPRNIVLVVLSQRIFRLLLVFHRYNVENSYLEEKEDTCNAMAEVALHTK